MGSRPRVLGAPGSSWALLGVPRVASFRGQERVVRDMHGQHDLSQMPPKTVLEPSCAPPGPSWRPWRAAREAQTVKLP
eukprot:9503011-Pyramimonas_sp.AAC.1